MCPTLAARTAEIRLGIDSTTFFMTQVFELTHSCATKFVSSALRWGDFLATSYFKIFHKCSIGD